MSLSNPEMHDPLSLAEALITCPSVTPATGAVFNVLEAALLPLGFAVDRWVMGEAPDGPVENLIAVRTNGTGRHFAFAGHRCHYSGRLHVAAAQFVGVDIGSNTVGTAAPVDRIGAWRWHALGVGGIRPQGIKTRLTPSM